MKSLQKQLCEWSNLFEFYSTFLSSNPCYYRSQQARRSSSSRLEGDNFIRISL